MPNLDNSAVQLMHLFQLLKTRDQEHSTKDLYPIVEDLLLSTALYSSHLSRSRKLCLENNSIGKRELGEIILSISPTDLLIITS